MVTSFPAQPAHFPYLSYAHWKIPIWPKEVLHENLLILSKPSNKTNQEDGQDVPCLMCFQISLISWSFFSPSPDSPHPMLPDRQAAMEAGGTRHQHGLCPRSHVLLATCTSGQGAAIYVVWLRCPLGCLAFWSFPQQDGLLCQTPSCWLWNNTMQWSSLILLADFFFFKFWCKMTSLSKIVCFLENFSFDSQSAGSK